MGHVLLQTLGLADPIWSYLQQESVLEYIPLDQQPFSQFWNPAVEQLTFFLALLLTHDLFVALPKVDPVQKLRWWKATLAAAFVAATAHFDDNTSDQTEQIKLLRKAFGVTEKDAKKLSAEEVVLAMDGWSHGRAKRMANILTNAKVPKSFFRDAPSDLKLALAKKMLDAALNDPAQALRGE